MKFSTGLFLMLGLFLGIEIYRTYLLSKAMKADQQIDEDVLVSTHREGKIVYLIFSTTKGITSHNYTIDSMEYEFIHPPTKLIPNGTPIIDAIEPSDNTYHAAQVQRDGR